MYEFNAGEAPSEGRADFPKLELAKDEVARINLLTLHGWGVTVRHWVDGMGYVHCHAVDKIKVENPQDMLTEMLKIQDEGGRPDDCKLCAQISPEGQKSRVGFPKRQFAVRILRYKTDLQGNVSQAGGLNYWLCIWLIDNKKYRAIQKIIGEWGDEGGASIREHDLQVTCDDQQYQSMTIQPLRNALWIPLQKEVVTYFQEEAQKYDLGECLGRTMTEEAFMRRFSQAARQTQVEPAPDFPYSQPTAEPVGSQPQSTTGADPFAFNQDASGKIPPVEQKQPDTPKVSTSDGDFLDDLLSGKKPK